ncbi:MAG: hypothetical protein ABIJ21_09270 [Nanoarchaeota archaeon]
MMKEDYYYEEAVFEPENESEDFYNEEEMDRELEEGMISPEEEAFARGYINALE